MWLSGIGTPCDFLTLTVIGDAGTCITTYGVTVIEGRAVLERLAEHAPSHVPEKIAKARQAKFEHRQFYTVDLRTMACDCLARGGGCKHKAATEALVAEGLIGKPNTSEG